MGHEPSDRPGIIMSIKALIGTLIELVQTRGRLIANEVEEEWLRFERRMLLMLTVMMFGGLGLTFLAAFFILLFWPVLGVFGVLCFALCYVGIAGVAAWQLRQQIYGKPSLFSVSFEELKKDGQAIGGSNGKA